ncbi:MAG: hypothetical protein CMP61_06835 [Flavobacteriales bacterium]|mgnify:CR=1 FL=1|nr:hypothetical protein [Flavobacteriales bacterium]|tara:strand:+ start:23243 stop:24757 length:1515 start_codon:yes stop_codon:yes gene_type:complete
MHKHILFFTLLFSNLLFSQKEVVEILGADKLSAGKTADYQKLIGNVALKYDQSVLYCDSAEVNGKSHDFEAWGKVFIKQQTDNLKAWGDHLIYQGETQIGTLDGNVKMQSENTLLKTEKLYFDKTNQQIYYLNGAHTNQDDSKIFSKKGFYDTSNKYLKLKDSVEVKNPEYIIKSDTLEYSTNSKTSYFSGPTFIELEKEKIYCESGFYNKTLEIGQFEKNAILKQDQQSLQADSIYFDKRSSISEAFEDVVLIDEQEHLKVSGDYGFFNQNDNFSFITKNVVFAQGANNSDSLFLVCDTLLLREENDSAKSFFAYRNVKLFQAEMAGKCDSLAYNMQDSLIKLFYDPILWNGESQLTGDSIELLHYDNKLQKLFVKNNGFISSLVDSSKSRYDQVKGRDLIGYFNNGKLDVMNVLGNGQTIYYAQEVDGKYTGVNKAICSNIQIHFNKGKIDRIKFITMPEATFFPINQFPKNIQKLDGFIWKGNQRPKTLSDILSKEERKID